MMTTPALELAAQLSAVAEHLRKHPHLPRVKTGGPAFENGLGLQISSYSFRGEPVEAAAVLLWAKTMPGSTITLRKNRGETAIWVYGQIGGHRVEVWDTDPGDIRRWRAPGDLHPTKITLEQLAAYVAAGTVEHADEHTAVTS